MTSWGWPSALLFGPALAWTAAVTVGSAWTLLDDDAWRPIDRRAAAVVGDDDCRSCHPEKWRSWHDSYHRTMTQVVDDAGSRIAAPFHGEQLTTLGFTATMDRSADGRPHLRVVDAEGAAMIDADVELAVGSHRVQQYVARIDRGGGPDERWRLPLAWHLGEARWIHLDTAFLAEDGVTGSRDDYLRHFVRYNDNCLFCHNTEPSPGLEQGRWHTTVGQWGIGCEACHGRASAHVQRQASPLRRVWSVAGPDPAIVDPGALTPERAADVCGRCHGQRIGLDIDRILAVGDGFVPGESLAAVSRPILRDAHLGDDPDTPFATRFWPDATPRLSAHEYQGLLASPCHDDGRGLHCNDCHDMHGDTPSMQLRRDFDRSGTCVRCHDTATLSAGAQHGGHGASVDCMDCHMPRTSYGLLQGMISHRVTSPDPGAAVGLHDRPDACTQCHVDRDRSWAAAAMTRVGLAGTEPARRPDARESWGPRVLLDLHGGDPIQRALAVDALAQPRATASVSQRLSWVVDAMADDYAAVRWMAWVAARRLAADADGGARVRAALAAFDPEAEPASRLPAWQAIRAALGPGAFDDAPARREVLEASRDAQAIWIGE